MRKNSVIWPYITEFFRNKWLKLRNNCENFCVGWSFACPNHPSLFRIGPMATVGNGIKTSMRGRPRNGPVQSTRKPLQLWPRPEDSQSPASQEEEGTWTLDIKVSTHTLDTQLVTTYIKYASHYQSLMYLPSTLYYPFQNDSLHTV